MELNAYNILKNQKEEILPIVKFEFKKILEKIQRRLTVCQTLRNPWTVAVKHDIYNTIYYAWFRSVRDHNIAFGRTVQTTPRMYSIRFTDIRSLIFHCSKGFDLSNNNAKKFVVRTIHECKVELIPAEDTPVIFSFDRRKNVLTITVTA